ncbi:MAG: aspartyl/asparaginyl beta-hydroxylase domain-containing protein [Chitinophagaceae bacterium]|nr:aspartyl/asparaginyl beta-hydroxylase domain-containing protein [Chitinophagaceae bacterium]
MMLKYLKLPFLFDVIQMQQEVEQLGNTLWKLHYQVKHYNGEWSAVPLRSINGETGNVLISPVEDATLYKDTALLNDCPYLKQVLKKFECNLMAVRLLKLTAGTQIHEHKDADLCIEEGLVRFHIPVITNTEIDFYLQGEKMVLQEGECWYMNFNLPHSLHNKSKTDRIHLVIDAEVNDWVKNLFSSPKIKIKKEIEDKPKHNKEEQLEIISHLRKMNTAVSNKLADDMEKQLN